MNPPFLTDRRSMQPYLWIMLCEVDYIVGDIKHCIIKLKCEIIVCCYFLSHVVFNFILVYNLYHEVFKGRKRFHWFHYAKSDYFDYFGLLIFSNYTQFRLSFAVFFYSNWAFTFKVVVISVRSSLTKFNQNLIFRILIQVLHFCILLFWLGDIYWILYKNQKICHFTVVVQKTWCKFCVNLLNKKPFIIEIRYLSTLFTLSYWK